MRVAIVLAAGASRRMGRSKLELDLGGKTVMERSVHSYLAANVDYVRLVVSPETAPPRTAGIDVVVNPDRDRGLSSSLKVGLAALPDDARVILVALADKPLVKPETIIELIAAFERGGTKVVYPVYRGEQGHPVLFDRSLVDELTAMEGDRGARAVIDTHADEARAVDVDDPGVCLDIDTPEDYQAAREQAGKGS